MWTRQAWQFRPKFLRGEHTATSRWEPTIPASIGKPRSHRKWLNVDDRRTCAFNTQIPCVWCVCSMLASYTGIWYSSWNGIALILNSRSGMGTPLLALTMAMMMMMMVHVLCLLRHSVLSYIWLNVCCGAQHNTVKHGSPPVVSCACARMCVVYGLDHFLGFR